MTLFRPLRSVCTFYADGFRNMKIGKKLWAIIFIKLFVMFAILKVFFFPNYLQEHFDTNKQRADFVLEQISSGPDAAVNDKNHQGSEKIPGKIRPLAKAEIDNNE